MHHRKWLPGPSLHYCRRIHQLLSGLEEEGHISAPIGKHRPSSDWEKFRGPERWQRPLSESLRNWLKSRQVVRSYTRKLSVCSQIPWCTRTRSMSNRLYLSALDKALKTLSLVREGCRGLPIEQVNPPQASLWEWKNQSEVLFITDPYRPSVGYMASNDLPFVVECSEELPAVMKGWVASHVENGWGLAGRDHSVRAITLLVTLSKNQSLCFLGTRTYSYKNLCMVSLHDYSGVMEVDHPGSQQIEWQCVEMVLGGSSYRKKNKNEKIYYVM